MMASKGSRQEGLIKRQLLKGPGYVSQEPIQGNYSERVKDYIEDKGILKRDAILMTF